MFNALLYSTILVLNGVLNTHKIQDTCEGIHRNIHAIQSAQSFSGYHDPAHNEQIDFLQRKYAVLDCERIHSSGVPEIIIASKESQCEHFQKLFCPQINNYLSQDQSPNSDEKLQNDIQRFSHELGGCESIPKPCTFIENDDSCSKPYQN